MSIDQLPVLCFTIRWSLQAC